MEKYKQRNLYNMESQKNSVQLYIDKIHNLKLPDNPLDILDFLSTLDNEQFGDYISFILSQSHIFSEMFAVFKDLDYFDLYFGAGYEPNTTFSASSRNGHIIPKLDSNNKLEFASWDSNPDKYMLHTDSILKSLQKGDKSIWKKFAEAVKERYPTRASFS